MAKMTIDVDIAPEIFHHAKLIVYPSGIYVTFFDKDDNEVAREKILYTKLKFRDGTESTVADMNKTWGPI